MNSKVRVNEVGSGYMFVFNIPLPVFESGAVFVEGESLRTCRRKFLNQIPGLKELWKTDRKAKQLSG